MEDGESMFVEEHQGRWNGTGNRAGCGHLAEVVHQRSTRGDLILNIAAWNSSSLPWEGSGLGHSPMSKTMVKR